MADHQVPEGSIIITPAEVYSKVTSLTDAVRDLIASDKAEEQARAELKLQVAQLATKVESKADNARVDKIDSRVSVIEKKLLLATGAAAAAGAGIGSWLPKFLGS